MPALMSANSTAVREYLTSLQARIVGEMEALDGMRFGADEWMRAEGGGGLTRMLEGTDEVDQGHRATQ